MKISYRQKEVIVKAVFFTVLMLAVMLAVGCSKKGTEVEVAGAKDDFEVTFLFEKDGCRVYRFYDYRSHYFTNCTQTMTIQGQQSGKTRVHWEENIGGQKEN